MPVSRVRVKKVSLREKLRNLAHKILRPRRRVGRRRLSYWLGEKAQVKSRSKWTDTNGREYLVTNYNTGGSTLRRRFSKAKGKANAKRHKRTRMREMLLTKRLAGR